MTMSVSGMMGALLLVAAVTVVTLPGDCQAFVLDGSPSSYAQFRKWYVGVNGSLALEFRTEEPNGLLMYTDDGGTFDFFELKLVEGALRLRYNLGGGAAILTIGRNLNDGRWHKVTIARRGNVTRLGVDDESSISNVRGVDLNFGNYTSNSDVLMGGLPSDKYASHLTLLALPSAYFEPRLRGAIRNVMYADSPDGLPKRQEFVTYDGVRLSHTDACERNDPCENGGICISTDKGAYCNCRHVDFEGKHCDKERAPTEATFRGADFLSYQSSEGAQPIVSSSDEITFSFKTRQPHGLLFFTGDGEHCLNVALKDGGVILTLILGAEPMERYVKPPRIRFDDNQWHKVAVHREVRQISETSSFCDLLMTVDDIYKDAGMTTGIFTLLSSSVMYIGGSENVAKLPGSRIKNNFVGCLRKVEFKADSLSLNLLELGRTSNKMINVHGKVDFMCQEVGAADPVTFTTSESYLVLPNWDATRAGSISFKLKTSEANGLLMYNSGAVAAGGDFFAFELLDGHVFLILNLGSGAERVKASGNRRVDDGQWHTVSLRRNGRSGRVSVDESAADFNTPGESNQLDLAGPLFVGGLGPGVGYEGGQVSVPSDLWTGPLGLGFVGCIRDLVVNGKAVDIAAYARHQDSGSIRSSCHAMNRQCDSQPCMNGGICSEGWNRFVCDCKDTGFLGPTCGKDATTLSFDGEQYVRVTMTEVSRTQAEDISIRFHTNRPTGLILLTKSNRTSDRLELAIEGGRARFILNLGDGEKVLFAGHGLNDNQWHTLRISRRGRSMELRVDDELHVIDEYPGKHTILEIQQLHIGLAKFVLTTSSPSTSPSSPVSSIHAFVGHMQRFIFNGQAYFDLARSGQAPQVEITAVFGRRENIVHHPVTFKSKLTFVSLPRLKAYATMNVYFQFKTIEMNGLILFNGGVGQDFIAIELFEGHLHFVFNLGDGPRRVRSNTKAALNDNRWHAVTIARPTLHQHTLIVDDMIATVTISGSNMHLDLDGLLYIGGVAKDMYAKLPKLVQSKHGFEGCIASLDLNGDTPDPSTDATFSSSLVLPGCDGPSSKCSVNACSNRGVCIQQWNGYTCDCDMTTFTGPTCADESLAYDFYRSVPGLITFNFPSDKRPETKGDLLAIGFATKKDDAVFFRVDSNGTNDYMELGIVKGNVLMMYNMGTEDHALGELGVRVNDGEYHVVRFTRSGSNATIQVDDYNVQAKHPGGKQLSVFNSQAKIQIGGRKNPLNGSIERRFKGTIAGLAFNGLRILDLVADHDSRVTVEGDVAVRVSMASLVGPKMARLAVHHPSHLTPASGSETPLPQMQRTPAIAGIGSDELVFSGSGCGPEDDEDCISPLETGSGDDLFTPVYIPPTPKPRKPSTSPAPMARTPKTHGGHVCAEDDEDCQEGSSGAGEFGTSLATPSPQPLTPSFTVPPPSLTHEPEEGTPQSQTPGTNFRHPPSPSPPHFPYEDDTDNGHENGGGRGEVYNPVTPTPYRPLKPENNMDVYENRRINMGGSASGSGTSGTSTSDSVALIIGIIAGILCGVVIVILLVCCCCRPSEGSYKVDESKNYQFAATVPSGPGGSPGGGGQGVSPGVMVGGVPGGVGLGLGCGLPPPGVGFINGQQLQMNGNVKMGEKAGKLPKKKEMKDIKEWYV